MTIDVRFLPDDITVAAEPGAPWLQVAEQAGISIPTGCLMGSCHACEIELEGGNTVCACISAVPLGRPCLTVTLYQDPTW
jgi:ferredoxin